MNISRNSRPPATPLSTIVPGEVFQKTGKNNFGAYYIRTDQWNNDMITAVNLGSGVLIHLAATTKVRVTDASLTVNDA